MMRRLPLCPTLVLAFGLAIAGCPDVELAVERCEDIQDQYCERVEACDLLLSKEDCLSEVRQDLDCGDAFDTTDDYDRCIDEIQQSTCGSLDDLPASCHGVILLSND